MPGSSLVRCAIYTRQAVVRILRNPTYAGLLADETRGVHAAVVSRELFNRVAATIEARRTRPPTPRLEVEGAVDPFSSTRPPGTVAAAPRRARARRSRRA